ncbi:TlpA family protein disulfide reductase [Sinomicrobium soli]|uniref:TlpA family protein disulfide reductase n=1 Tax=Sinomicrobium sp. N-1-3-6 TaxID=2219864 RepID=UPI000DCF19BE|nr:TlpA disulfide reductase family protein [Sinomicrobium sp. N-1-3-6]RAV29077.1 AhpC/TSA family protein [Sinomicrobium sp. N-1-3-6]
MRFVNKMTRTTMALLTVWLTGCQEKTKEAEKNDTIIVTGQVEHFKDTTGAFTYYNYEFLKNLQTERVDFSEEGKFRMELKTGSPVKGWFSFGKVPVTREFQYTTIEGKDTTMRTGTVDLRMVYLYLLPGDSLHLEADAERLEETLSFSGTNVDNSIFVNAEDKRFNDYKHKFLKNWYDVANRKPDDYKRITDSLYREKLDFLADFSSRHSLSQELVHLYETDYYGKTVAAKVNYPAVYASYNDLEETPLPGDYYDFLDKVKFGEEIGENGMGYYYSLDAYLDKKYEVYRERNKTGDVQGFYDWVGTELPEKIHYQYMAYALAGDFSKELYDRFGADSPYPEMASVVREKYKDMEGMLEGNPAPEAVFEDTDGGKMALSDLRGKYTYIDLWATWCGPCKKEIPSLKKVARAYEGKNIQFVSISFDKEKDRGKWKDFVEENDLDGIQLIADKKAHDIISKAFNIKMIPRFILLDPEGKIVDATAPFPSDQKLLELFDELNI